MPTSDEFPVVVEGEGPIYGHCSVLACDGDAVNTQSGLCIFHKCRVPHCNNYAWYYKSTGFCVEHNNRGRYPELHRTSYCINCGEEALPGLRECVNHVGTIISAKNTSPSEPGKGRRKINSKHKSILQDLKSRMSIDSVSQKYGVTTRTVYNVARKAKLEL